MLWGNWVEVATGRRLRSHVPLARGRQSRLQTAHLKTRHVCRVMQGLQGLQGLQGPGSTPSPQLPLTHSLSQHKLLQPSKRRRALQSVPLHYAVSEEVSAVSRRLQVFFSSITLPPLLSSEIFFNAFIILKGLL